MSSAPLPTDRRFTGQKEDSATGLYYYNARYYDPVIGTFLSPDTLVPDPSNVFDYNRFGYVRGNPLRYTDPSGHEPIHHSNYPCSYQPCIKDPSTGKWAPVPTWTPELQEQYYGAAFDQLYGLGSEATVNAAVVQAFASLENMEIPVEVVWSNGVPAVKVSHNQLTEALRTPLKLCATKIGGVCGVSVGRSTNGGGAGVRGDIAVYSDQEGNLGLFGEIGGGGYTPWPGPDGRFAITGIPKATIQDLDGMAGQFGGSGAIGWAGATAEAVFLRADSGKILRGQSYGNASSLGIGGELHLTFTWSQPMLYLQVHPSN